MKKAKIGKPKKVRDYKKTARYKELARKEKEADKAFLATLKDMKNAPYEEFRKVIPKWLEGFFRAVRNLENETVEAVIDEKQFQQDLMEVLGKRTAKDQEEFKNFMHNDEVMHKWLEDMAEMAFFNAMVTFKIYHKRGMTEAEVRRLAKPYHIDPLFLDSPENPWRKAEEMFCAAMQTVAAGVEGEQS